MTGRTRSCSHPGCAKSSVARRLCRPHYQAAWKAGSLGEHHPQQTRPRNRVVCPAEHKHADSSTCYIQHQCRCDPCMDHHAEMIQRRNRLRAYGRFDTGLVDIAPVREHMTMLGEYGIGYKRVADLAGIGVTAARTILWGRQEPGPRNGELQKRVKRETAEKILGVRADLSTLARGALVTSRGTHRRVQALVALGWSLSEIGRRIGMDVGNVGTMLKRDHVSVATHRAVAAVFDELSMTPAPADEWRQRATRSRSLAFAKARRWLPPLAWDDIDSDPEPPALDDETAVDDIAVDLALSGEHVRLSPAERREAITRAHARKWSDRRTAHTIRCAVETVGRIRQELGLEAWPFEELEKVS